MIHTLLIDRTPHQRMNGVARYMLGLTSHPDPHAMGIDLRILNWGRELTPERWRQQFAPSVQPHHLATWLNRQLLRPLRQACSRADVIHYPFHYLPSDWTSGAGAKIITVHGASAFSQALWEPERGNGIKRGLHRGIDRLAKIITVSEWSKKEIVEYFGLPSEKVVVIPNGVELERFRPLQTPADKQLLDNWLNRVLNIKAPYLLHVGPSEPRKNVLTLVRAFAELKQRCRIPHMLVLAGAHGRHATAVAQEIERQGIANAVVKTGSVDDAALVNLYNGADLLIFPSLYEGFGIPVLEAMACGTPVVTANVTALPEIVGDAALLVDDPTDSAALAHLCEKVLGDAGLQARLRESGLAHVQSYSWVRSAAMHLTLYKEIAEGM